MTASPREVAEQSPPRRARTGRHRAVAKYLALLLLGLALAACDPVRQSNPPVLAPSASRDGAQTIPRLAADLPAAASQAQLFTGAEMAPDGAVGRFYFYRTQDPMLIAVQPDLIVNGRKVGVSRAGEIFYRDAKPGRYKIFTTSDPDIPILVNLLAGQIRYIRTAPQLRFLGMRIGPQLIDPGLATKEIKNLHVASQE
jgi:hypothetical protein